ncbi:MobF family relaxase [Streptomyces sp. NBC_01304]|uniref:MobF family relaxase n=1 Tax=Streptomyces sp. NBC_01304 TaxID=2903818 RepID=UPI002E1674A1|nr:relaxase domain-containing protein [Streptomyces sp. NBC_01304]
MLRFTRITGGEAGLSYLLSGGGCEGGHQQEAEATLSGPEAYYAKGVEQGAPVATWLGAGVKNFGLTEGTGATERDIRAIFGQHAHPEQYRAAISTAKAQIDAEGLTGKAAEKVMADAEASARLGRKAYTYRTVEERTEARLAKEPHAEPERIAEIRREERAKGQNAPAMYFDATFSAQKSISVLHTALQAAGRHEEAAKVLAGHHEGIKAATEYLQKEAGYGRIGYHGQAKGDRPSTGRYVDGHEWTAAVFDHQVSRAGDPQMHSHVALLNKIKVTDEYGQEHWVSLDSRALNKARAAASAIYERTMEQAIERDTDVVFETRPDGKSREIKGMAPELLDAMSERKFEVDDRYQELLENYRQDHGREPSELMKTRLKEVATLSTRDPKRNEHQSPEARIERAERLAAEVVDGGLAAVLDKAEAAGLEIRLAESGEVDWDREKVIGEALETLQTKRSTWDRSALIQQLNTTLGDQLPRDIPLAPLANELADEALRSGRYGVVQTAGLSIIEDAPSRIRESDGRSVFGPGQLGAEKFALEEHLSKEDRVASRARQTGAPCLSQQVIDEVVRESGVTADQADVVRGVLGDSKKVSVIEGPAGAGKSFATGVIAKAWEQHTGGRVIGLGPSAVAAEVLGEEGIEIRANTAKFLDLARGRGSAEDIAKLTLRAGDLVMLDEAAMTSTDHMSRISQMAEDAGAKLVTIGDQEQQQSPEAGGLFRQMVEDGPHYSLNTVRRFKNEDGTVREWEAKASLALRKGDARALEEYDRHGLIQGGTLEQMKGAVVQAYLADTLAGRESVVITVTNARATELSREIRGRLVEYGFVQEHGADLVDDNRAGVGDLIQARNNDPKLKDSDGMLVLNRRVYRVTGIGDEGQLSARRVAGRNDDGTERLAGAVSLPKSYVKEHVTLAYAGTSHAVQGRTVGHGGYTLAEEGMTRQQVYPSLTRAIRVNRIMAVSEVPADEHRIEGLSRDPLGLIQGALSRDGGELAALQELRESQDWAESIPALEPKWRDYVNGHNRERFEGQLRQLLSSEQFAELQTQDPSTVYRALREAELAGHDGQRVLNDAIKSASMTSPEPENVAKLVNWRIAREMENRQPEGPAAGHSWTDRTPEIPGIEGRVARELAAAMDERRDVLGERLTDEPPEWAVRHIGPVPEDTLERAEWARRAGTVEGYRELYGIDAPNTAIGRLPAKGAIEQRAAWEAAHVALGRTEGNDTLIRTNDATLREMVARYERETSWAPAHVGEELSEARQAERRYEEKAILTQAEADQATDPERRAELEEEARGYEDLVSNFHQRVEVLEQIDEARGEWYEETAPAREAAEAARTELERRGLDDQAQAVQAADERDQNLDEERVVEPEYDLDQAPDIDWEIEGATLDQAPEVRDEAELTPLSQAEQEELQQALAAYEQQHRAPQAAERDIDWDVEGTTLDQAPEVDHDGIEQQLAEQDEQQWIESELDAEAASYHADRQAEAEQAPEIDWAIEGETWRVDPDAEQDVEAELEPEHGIEPTAEADTYVYEPNPELDAAIEAYAQQLREKTTAANEAEPEYDLDQAPDIDWEIEGVTHAQRPEQLDAEQERAPEASTPTPEDEYRELYEQQAAQQVRAGTDLEAPAAEQLPGQLADLQADLEQAHGALAEIAARRAEREQAAETERAEQIEVSRRTREAEVQAVPEIDQGGPTMSYGSQG